MTLGGLDVPSATSQNAFLSTLGKDQTRTVESSLAEAKRTSSGEKLRLRTASRYAVHTVGLFMLSWGYLTILDLSADARCGCRLG